MSSRIWARFGPLRAIEYEWNGSALVGTSGIYSLASVFQVFPCPLDTGCVIASLRCRFWLPVCYVQLRDKVVVMSEVLLLPNSVDFLFYLD
jgi:hypothetical protein